MVFEYPIQRAAPFNGDKLLEELQAVASDIAYRTEDAGEIIVVSGHELVGQELIDVTAVVENHNPALLTQQQEIDQARAALQAGKLYLQKQLASATPHTLTQLVSNMKPAVDGNTFLLRMVENKIDVMSVAFGWTAADVKTPETAPNDNALNRSRYVEAVMQIIALLAQD